jgi:transglutaminase-like putative cysteine protease
MTIPKFLLGVTVLFWGSQTGLWLIALPLAVILEAPHWFDYRWHVSETDFKRIANFCAIASLTKGIALIILLIYFIITNRSNFSFIYQLFIWLPLILAPLVIAQIYSVQAKINLSTLFFWGKLSQKNVNNQKLIDLKYPYFFLCLIASAATNTRNILFYLGLLIIIAIFLWQGRGKRFAPIVWLSLLLLAGSIGFISHLALHQLHLALENQVVEWLVQGSGDEVDFAKKQTNMGEIGKLKQSNQIIMRVSAVSNNSNNTNNATPANIPPPRLLRQATYNKYQSPLWLAVKSNFTPIKPTENETTWQLSPTPEVYSSINITTNLTGSKGLLKIPDSTFQIDQLAVDQMEQNQYGTVQVTGKNQAIAYQARFNKNLTVNSLSTPADLEIPAKEKIALEQIISQLNIKNKSPQQILDQIEIFFLKNFQYSLDLTTDKATTPLSAFLLNTRSGHCEYFASATTLLLRALGIPARYAVGYSVHEFSNWEKQYIVRERHAHAWSLAYINGKWQAVDTTPSNWTSQEDATVSKFAWVGDLWSFVTFQASLWFKHILGYFWQYAGIVLGGFILWWLWQRRGKKRGFVKVEKLKKKEHIAQTKIIKRREFDLIEQKLNQLGFIRYPAESWKNWLKRLQSEQPNLLILQDLLPLIELYYSDRFDPQGISQQERERLKVLIKGWLQEK